MDLLYSWEGDNCIWLGFPCPQISGAERKEVIQYGLNNLYQHADVGLLWAKDQELVPQDMLVRNLGQFILVGHNSHQIEKSSQIIMEKYLNEN